MTIITKEDERLNKPVECDVCEGDGYIFIPVAWSADELREKCPVCNGKGSTLEVKNV